MVIASTGSLDNLSPSPSVPANHDQQMLPLPSPPSLRLPLFSLPSALAPPHLKPYPKPASLPAASTFSPYFSPRHQPNPKQQQQEEDDDHVIGDCLVFEDGAFEDGDASPHPDLDRVPERLRRRKPASATDAAEVSTECLVPEKWKEAAAEINITKKEKRRIAHQLKFGSRLERRKKLPLPDMEEYQAYREMKLAQLNPVVLDEPREFPPEKEAVDPSEMDGALRGGRVAPRNPRLGLGGKSLEDITDFFNYGYYTPEEMSDGTKKQGKRKLFTKEEKVLLNKRMPNLAEATSSKWLPLHTLASSGEFYILDMLLRHNVDINAVDKDGLSALHKSIICKKQAIVNYLLRNSANPFVRDKDGATLIHYAVQTASSQTIKILLLYNVDINLPDNDGWTPLHLAVQTQRTDIVRLLLMKGADRTLNNQEGLTPLGLCLYSGRATRTYELIKLLKSLPRSKSLP